MTPPALAVIACDVLEDETRHFARAMPHVRELIMLPQGLHKEPQRLQREVQGAIDRAEALPDVPLERREVAMTILKMTMSETGKRISEEQPLAERVDVYADAVADMFCAYLDRLAVDATVQPASRLSIAP